MTIWQQVRMSAEQLIIGGALAEQWMLFTIELHNGHTHLKAKPDSLIWSQNRPYGRGVLLN